MPRDGAIIFSDLIGKLDLIRVACDKCGRYPTMHGALLRRINDPNSVLNAKSAIASHVVFPAHDRHFVFARK